MIFRDDDISISTDLSVLKPVHDKFKQALVMHTVAVICKDLDQNLELVAYLKKENFNIQLHCWDHYNFAENKDRLQEDLPKCLDMFQRCGFDRPTILYPPWNKTTQAVNVMVWNNFKIDVSNQKCSLSYYVANNGNVPYDTVNFHYWDDEVKDLEEALKIYNTKR